MRNLARVVLLLLLTAIVAGCGARGVKIAELHHQPHRYDDKTVRLTGVVTGAWGVPVLFQVYSLDDGTGEIAVVSRDGWLPPPGARVQVQGRLTEVASVRGRSIGVHLLEERRTLK